MSIDSKESSSCPMRSKYFTRNSAMDESLSDFQETKQSCAGPKNTNKSKSSKPKKAPKRIRGQKDIRTVLRSKKNELESYSKDFDNVCKKAGIDVDSEQLQLAIALSKSLQDTASTSNESTQIVNTTQDRIGKIRTTLQEYGFKVPEVKIAGNTRKLRKPRTNYKLITISDTEKRQNIADKYSQILLQNITHCDLCNSDIDTSNIPLFHLASNVTYEVLKNFDTFYVNSLIEKSTTTRNLLRDWSEIPGRPVSPKLFDPSNVNFSEIECSQDELDIVLSGSLKSCKNIISSKNKDIFSCKIYTTVVEDDDVNNFTIENNMININEIQTSDHENTLKVDNNESDNVVEPISTTKPNRSYSPDIFDDDASSIFDNSKNLTIQKEESFVFPEKPETATKTNSEIMDLTECVHSKTVKPLDSVYEKGGTQLLVNSRIRKSNNAIEITECIKFQSKEHTILENIGLQFSQKNVTKRRSNDFMEMTECVATLSQPILMKVNIDLTQSHDIIEDDNDVTDKEKSNKTVPDKNEISLSKTHVKLTEAAPNLLTSEDHDIDLTESPESHNNGEFNNEITKRLKEAEANSSIEGMDLTQSSNTSDELPFVSLTAAQSSSLDDTIIVDINEYVKINKISANSQDQEDMHIDLTQNQGSAYEVSNHSQSFFEEYIHDHSDNFEESTKSSSGKTVCKQSISGIPNRGSQSILVTSLDIVEKPVEDHHCNLDFKRCKPGKIDLTRPNRKSSSDNSFSNSFEEPADKHFNQSCSHTCSQKKTGDINTLRSPRKNTQKSCSEIIVEPVEYTNTGPTSVCMMDEYEQSISDKVDLTQNSERKSSNKSNHSNSHEELAVNFGVNSYLSSKSQSKPGDMDHTESPRERSICNLPVEHLCNTGPQQCKPDKVNSALSPIRNCNEDDISDIDLTQNSESSEELSQSKDSNSIINDIAKDKELDSNIFIENNEITSADNLQRFSGLGKKDDVSIDYDEVLYINAGNDCGSTDTISQSLVYEIPDENIEKPSKNSLASNCSQNSEVFEISDKELDYSLHQSKLEIPRGNFAFGGLSIMDELSNLGLSKKSVDIDNMNNVNETENGVYPTTSTNNNRCKEISPIKHRRITEIATPLKASSTNMVTVVTPKNSELIIKTKNVTPFLDYESMSTPDIHKELDKYGIKPFKRKRAIQLLTHIYTQTHPTIETYDDELASPPKRHKPNDDRLSLTPRKLISPRKLLRSPTKDLDTEKGENNIVNKKAPDSDATKGKGKSKSSEINKGTTDKTKESHVSKKGKAKGKGKDNLEKGNQTPSTERDEVGKSIESGTREADSHDAPIIKDIHCKPEDWVFQKREKAKVHSCRVPLHIAFHNYVASRRHLREAILCYEPVEIDIIHKDLVAYGHRYDPKDLLKFLDKKCITVKTTDNDGRNQKR